MAGAYHRHQTHTHTHTFDTFSESAAHLGKHQRMQPLLHCSQPAVSNGQRFRAVGPVVHV